jgi:UDP-2-acetamido-2,6-beta-L-arabino-hexul-4-ose reductase
MKVLVTGACGFVGRNLCAALATRDDVSLVSYDVGSSAVLLEQGLREADVVYHLAGVNRPKNPDEFAAVNRDFTKEICDTLVRFGRRPALVLASSIQAELDNPYGQSKRAAEEVMRRFCQQTGARGVVHRFKNLFGKWCRPNYNSVTATFCHNIANGLPIQISDPASEVDLTYIDEVVAALTGELGSGKSGEGGFQFATLLPSYRTTLGELAALIESFREHRMTLRLPDFSREFVRALYATYLSYLPSGDFAYALGVRSDARGSLAEFLKSPALGQLFISRTRPGVTRGNHYHHTKTEKFLVVAGAAVIRLRSMSSSEVVELRVSGEEYRVVDIPPGYTHSIENVGSSDLVTLFWASEMFDVNHPDTSAQNVLQGQGTTQ